MEANPHVIGCWSYYWILSKHFGKTLWREGAKDLVYSSLLAIFTGAGTWIVHTEDAWAATKIGLISVAGWYAVVALWHLVRSPWHLHRDREVAVRAAQETAWRFGLFAVVVVLLIFSGISLLFALYPFLHPKVIDKVNVIEAKSPDAGDVKPSPFSKLNYVWVPPGNFPYGLPA